MQNPWKKLNAMLFGYRKFIFLLTLHRATRLLTATSCKTDTQNSGSIVQPCSLPKKQKIIENRILVKNEIGQEKSDKHT